MGFATISLTRDWEYCKRSGSSLLKPGKRFRDSLHRYPQHHEPCSQQERSS